MSISKKERLAYIATESTITLIFDGQHRTIQIKSKTHRNEVIAALERFRKSPQTDFDKQQLEIYLAPIRRAVLASDKRLEVSPDGKILYLVGSTVPIPSRLGNHIVDFLENKLPVDALVKFWESCLKNPHYVAVDELFIFLEENKLPITDDGGFLGYKKLNIVRGQKHINIPDQFEELVIAEDGSVKSITGLPVVSTVANKFKEFMSTYGNPTMVDVHSGTIRQKLGEVVKIDRIQLNELARREECGYGLHIGAFGYSFNGDVRVLCKVMPEDVIACNQGQAKLRTCKYQIVSFVDAAREVKDLYVNLSGVEADIAAGDYQPEEELDFQHDFSCDDIVTCIDYDASNDLTVGDSYRVLDIDTDSILLVNDLGEKEWYDYESFDLE